LSRKEQILKVAMQHFSQYGYDATGMDAIASDCEITKPAIYYHYKDKAALYEAVICSHFSSLAKEIQVNTLEGNAKERIQRYIETFGHFLVTQPTFSAIFSREIAAGGKTLPESCSKFLSITLQSLQNILIEGEKEGDFEKENPFLIQMMIVATLSAYSTTKPLRERVLSHVEGKHTIDSDLEEIITLLSKKIIKALQC